MCLRKTLLCISVILNALIVLGNNYYIDNNNGNDNATGLSPVHAWQSLAKVNSFAFLPGDSVLFVRNGLWRGQLKPLSGNAQAYITYCAYDTGSKPLFLGSVNVSNTADWTDKGNNIWQSTQSFLVDAGNLIFNNGSGVGFKKWSAANLQNQGDFWYDKTGSQMVQLYSNGNPATVYSGIEAALGNFLVYAQADSFFVIQELEFKYGAADGIEIRNSHHIIIQDCDLSFIGGTELTTQVRYGGGIQFWANSNNNIVRRCRFWEIYDDAVTNQCTPSQPGTAQQFNLYYLNNLIWNCSESSYCCDLRPAILQGSFLKNIYFENNTCVNAGGGWAAAQRPDLKGFQLYFSAITAATDSIFIRNNVFYKSRAVLFVDNSSVHTLDYTAIDYNDWYTINDYDSIAAIWTSASLTVWNKTQFSAYQSATGQDHHSFMADALLSNVANCDFHLTSASPCINAGLNIGLANDFDLNQRPASGPCDVGAYQYLSTAIGSTHELFNNLRVYPNPAETNLNIDGVTTPLSVEIINNTGDTMYEGFLHPGKSVIDVHRFPSATYIVHLFANDKNSISRKIVIER